MPTKEMKRIQRKWHPVIVHYMPGIVPVSFTSVSANHGHHLLVLKTQQKMF